MDPGSFRRHGHDLVDWMAEYLEHSEKYFVLSRVKPGEIAAALPWILPYRLDFYPPHLLPRLRVIFGHERDNSMLRKGDRRVRSARQQQRQQPRQMRIVTCDQHVA